MNNDFFCHTGPKSVITIEQFTELCNRVVKLQTSYGVPSSVETGEIEINMSELQKKLSTSDPMALVQLSARLEQAEKNLENMMSILTELANRPISTKPSHTTTVKSKELNSIVSAETSLPSSSTTVIPPSSPPPSPPKAQKISFVVIKKF